MGKHIEVAAAVIHHEGCILATQRGYGDLAGGWEFPGGKLEPGETPEQALVREIHEELAALVAIDRLVCVMEHDTDELDMTMHCFLCHVTEGKLELLEHASARWLDAEHLRSVEWLPADLDLVAVLEEQQVLHEA
jgi:8-oxo-dGTP diphosphatase